MVPVLRRIRVRVKRRVRELTRPVPKKQIPLQQNHGLEQLNAETAKKLGIEKEFGWFNETVDRYLKKATLLPKKPTTELTEMFTKNNKPFYLVYEFQSGKFFFTETLAYRPRVKPE